MIGERARSSRCPLCGGRLYQGRATIPFLLRNGVVVVKDVPAEICRSCHEPFVIGEVTDRLTTLLGRLQSVNPEVTVLSYETVERPVAVVAEDRAIYALGDEVAEANDSQTGNQE